jgi:hypothetical protein
MKAFDHIILYHFGKQRDVANFSLHGEELSDQERDLLKTLPNAPTTTGNFQRETILLNELSRLGWEAWNITESIIQRKELIQSKLRRIDYVSRTISLRRPVSGSVDHPDHRKA